MRIIAMVAENFKRLKLVEIEPKGRMVQITGRNSQGKTSVIDAVWAGLAGKRAMPDKPVRKGAAGAEIRLVLGGARTEYVIRRTIAPTGGQTLTVETSNGTKVSSPQAMLDDLIGSVSIDPLAFIQMKPLQQIEVLRRTAKVDYNFEAADEANSRDFEERAIVNREVKRLEAEAANMVTQPDLPKDKIATAEIVARLNAVSTENKKIEAQREARAELGRKEEALWQRLKGVLVSIDSRKGAIVRLERELAHEKAKLKEDEYDAKQWQAQAEAAGKELEQTPLPEFVDVAALTAELEQANLVNREIERAERKASVERLLKTARDKSAALTRGMEARLEAKQAAMQSAAMPVAGLSWDETSVLYNGIPLDQLGEAEQIRVSAAIAMAGNPTLRVLRIMHGESMDEDSLAALAQLAEEKDFQIWMAKVDSSGKCGIVLEDGMVKDVAEQQP